MSCVKLSTDLQDACSWDELLSRILPQVQESLLCDATALLLFPSGSDIEATVRIGGVWAPRGQQLVGKLIDASRRLLKSRPCSGSIRPRSSDLGLNGVRHLAGVALPDLEESVGVLWAGFASRIPEDAPVLLDSLATIIASAIRRSLQDQKTEKRVQQLIALHAVDLAISSSLDSRVTLNVLCRQARYHLGVDAACILLFNPGSRCLEFAAGEGFRAQDFPSVQVRMGEGPAGQAALDRRTVTADSAAAQGERGRLVQQEGFRWSCATPLIAKEKVQGVLELFHRSSYRTDSNWQGFLESLSSRAAVAIEIGHLISRLEVSNRELVEAYDATIEGWATALELRDHETKGHTVRVMEMTIRLACSMGLAAKEQVHVRRGALLHDVGKLAIPDRILHKPGPLTEEEWGIMRQHPVLAHQMLSPIDYLRPALDIPYCHHERWDGQGYPRNLRGEEIPQSARIFSVIDVWDALRSDRPYRRAWSETKALDYIASQSGHQFDPAVVDYFRREQPKLNDCLS